jgi:hypothetical protein
MESLINGFGSAETLACRQCAVNDGSFPAVFALLLPFERKIPRLWSVSSSCHEALLDEEQIAKCEKPAKLRPVLDQSEIAGFGVTKLAFDDPVGILDLGPPAYQSAT